MIYTLDPRMEEVPLCPVKLVYIPYSYLRGRSVRQCRSGVPKGS